MVKRAARRILLRISRDPKTGHLSYPVNGKRVFLRFSEEAPREAHRRLWFDEIYFKCYLPSGDDCVVDIGAGLGIEAAMLAAKAPDVRYIANDIQPWVYECLALTFADLPSGFEAFGLAIGPERVRITPTRQGLDAEISPDGLITIENITWPAFKERFRIRRVDLLKMNVEGAEVDMLQHIDLDDVERVAVAVHDFRADRGEGEHLRTRAKVVEILAAEGFAMDELPYDWIFAKRT